MLIGGNKMLHNAENLTHPLLREFLERIINFGEHPNYLYWYNSAYDFVKSDFNHFYFYNKERNHYIYIVADSSLIKEALKIYKDKEKLFNKV